MFDKEFIIKKIGEINKYLLEIDPILKLSYNEFVSSYRDMRTAERDFQLIVDVAVDINTHIILSLNAPPPEKNYNSFIDLGKLKVMSEDEAQSLAPSTGLRNKLVHEYEEINSEMMYHSLKAFVVKYKDYGRSILSYLEEK